MPYEYQPLKTRMLPTLQQTKQALKKADETDESARDPRDLMSILVAMSERSPRLSGHILTRRAAISSYSWTVKARDAADNERAEKATARCRSVIRRAIDWHIDRHLYGAMAIELDWIAGTPFGTAPKILQSFTPTEVESNGRLREEVAILGSESTLTRTYPLKTDRPESWLIDIDDRRYRGGLLRTLIYHEILIHDNLQEWAAFNKKLKGIIQARFDQWATKEEKDAAIDALKKLAEHNYSATSKATEFVFNKTADYLGAAGFKDFKRELEADRSITILGQANTPSLPSHGGSRAALQVQSMITSDIHHESMIAVEQFINEQLLLHDWRMNGEPNATEAPYELVITLAEDLDPERQARIVQYAKGAGVPLRQDEVYERLQYSRPDPKDPDIFDWSDESDGLI